MKKKTLNLMLPLPVSVNHYLSHRVSGGKGKRFIQTYKTPQAMDFERLAKPIILSEVKKQNWEKPKEDIYIRAEVVWHFHKKGLDCNNMHKQVLDILQGCGVYENDSMVLECSSNYFINAKNPHCEITIYSIDKQGVFDNQEEKLNFCRANCHICSKTKTSCSFFKKLLENRIIEEVDLEKNICHKIKIKKTKKQKEEIICQ